MKQLLKFELKQYKPIILVILIVSISGFFLVQQNEVNNISKQILMESQIKNQGDKNIAEYNKDITSAIRDHNNQLYLNTAISLDKYYLNQNFYSQSEFAETKQYYQNRIDFNEYLLKNKIKSLNMINSAYNNLEEINGVSAVYNVMAKIVPIIMPLIILITAYRVFNIESAAYNYLMTLPYRKKDILLSKWLAVFIINLAILIFTIISAFFIGTLIGGIGEFNYPIVANYLNINNAAVILIDYKIYLFLVIILSMLNIAVYSTVGMFFSNIIKNRWVVLLINIMIGSIPMIYMFTLDYTYYSKLIPFVFDNAHAIITYNFSLINIIGFVLTVGIIVYLCVMVSNKQFKIREGL